MTQSWWAYRMRTFITTALLCAVVALVAACNSSSSSKRTISLQAEAASPARVELSWESTYKNATGFRVERSESGGAFEEVDELDEAATAYSDTGVMPDTRYVYRVCVLGSSGDLGCSEEVEVTTPDLGTFTLEAVVVSSTGIDLSWTYEAGDEEGFRIERRASGGAFEAIAEVDAGESAYSDSGLDPGTGYAYRVFAFDQDGDIACSEEAEAATSRGAVIVDHTTIDLSAIPEEWITMAKEDLHIAYGHTSHGSQLITGMEGLFDWKGDLYAFSDGGASGTLDLRDAPFTGASDLGNPNREAWTEATRTYLDENPEVNVVVWSWCGQVSGATEEDIDTYLELMSGLEEDYPGVMFVYMTGHLDGTGLDGNLHLRNEQIREFCRSNGKILYDFADIESYDPDGTEYLSLLADDACGYDSDDDGVADANWAQDWQAAHTEGIDWYDCPSAHSEPLNANMKAYAAWWLWARLAGWDGE